MSGWKTAMAVLCLTAVMLTMAACTAQAPQVSDASSEAESSMMVNQDGEESSSSDASSPGKEEPAAPQAVPADEPADEPAARTGSIVAYFSWTSHTQGIAEAIAEHVGADVYVIEPAEPYGEENSDYYNEATRAYIEQHDDAARPALASDEVSLAGYDTVYLGYPIWYSDSPRLMWTFVEAHADDLAGARVIPFCTSMSVGVGESARHLASLAPLADWAEGTRFEPGTPDADVAAWVDSIQ